MTLTNDEKAVIARLLEFSEEHWTAFMQRCEEAGYDEDEVERVSEDIKRKIYE